MRFIVLLIFFGGLHGSEVFAQMYFVTDTVLLNEVTVRSTRLEEFTIGAVVESPDSALVSTLSTASLAELLSVSTGVSVKNYGQGGVASVSLRGGGSSHTAVMWNGINIQSPMNGGVNLAVMPLAFNNDIKIQYGGAGTLYGSGAMSGIIHLSGKNLFSEENNITTDFAVGSFNTQSALARLKTGNKSVAFAITLFGKKSDNDFEFINTARMDKRREKQLNAGFYQKGFMKESHIRISDKSLITSALWYQHFDKDVQTLMTNSNRNRQNQVDDNLMGALNYKYYGNQFTLNLKQGAIWNGINYTDYAIPANSGDHKSLALVSEAEFRLNLRNGHIWSTGINYTTNKAESNSYDNMVQDHRLAAFSFLQINSLSNRLVSVFSLRNEMTDGTMHPIVFAYGGNYKLSGRFNWMGNFARNYRIPSFNDTFWGSDAYARGNPNLKPEYGWSGDTGFKYKHNGNPFQNEVTATIFFSRIEDWIVWLQDETTIWMPTNKKTGVSRGFELRWNNRLQHGSSVFGLTGTYNYTWSRMATDDVYDGNQMLYVPLQQASTVLNWKYAHIEAFFLLNAVGERYYDFTNTLKPYVTGALFINYLVPTKLVDLSFNFKIRNIWDSQYQVTAWYAMPMRNYEIALNLRF
jgi:vitamin B12 transporter